MAEPSVAEQCGCIFCREVLPVMAGNPVLVRQMIEQKFAQRTRPINDGPSCI
jgi:hypothetical protein